MGEATASVHDVELGPWCKDRRQASDKIWGHPGEEAGSGWCQKLPLLKPDSCGFRHLTLYVPAAHPSERAAHFRTPGTVSWTPGIDWHRTIVYQAEWPVQQPPSGKETKRWRTESPLGPGKPSRRPCPSELSIFAPDPPQRAVSRRNRRNRRDFRIAPWRNTRCGR